MALCDQILIDIIFLMKSKTSQLMMNIIMELIDIVLNISNVQLTSQMVLNRGNSEF